jgi:hypothetical protein
MNCLRINSHLTAAMFNLWHVLTSILILIIGQSLVKSICVVVQIYNFIAETVDKR